jgi:hypothetical protein
MAQYVRSFVDRLRQQIVWSKRAECLTVSYLWQWIRCFFDMQTVYRHNGWRKRDGVVEHQVRARYKQTHVPFCFSNRRGAGAKVFPHDGFLFWYYLCVYFVPVEEKQLLLRHLLVERSVTPCLYGEGSSHGMVVNLLVVL